MIHVQIASELTTDGVRGVRWVLLEAAEPRLPEAEAVLAPGVTVPATSPRTTPTSIPTTAQSVAQQAAPAPALDPLPAVAAGDSVADSLRLRALKALVVALGLGAALWTAAVQIGPPGRVAPATSVAKPAAKSAANPPAPGVAPHAMPTLPSTPASPAAPQSATDTPAAPASAGLPRLTASL